MLRNVFKFSIVLLAAIVLMAGLSGCGATEEPRKVDLGKREKLEMSEILPEENSIRIAVGAIITPREGFAYYRHFLDYIGEKLGRPVEFVDKKSYAEINALLESRDIDAAFVCSRPYIDGHDEFGLELLVVPQAYGETVYYSYIIVNTESSLENFEDLRGKTFAFSDPQSNTGKLVPTYMLAKMGEIPDSFFKEYIFTYAHDESIKTVARKLVDGSAVDSLIWDYADKINPEFTRKTKIIWKSPPYGIPPVVVHPDTDPELKNKLRKIFLGVHQDEKGREILKGMMIDKFVTGDDSAYDSVREMKTWIAQQEKGSEE